VHPEVARIIILVASGAGGLMSTFKQVLDFSRLLQPQGKNAKPLAVNSKVDR
jgi:hypothetical protein